MVKILNKLQFITFINIITLTFLLKPKNKKSLISEPNESNVFPIQLNTTLDFNPENVPFFIALKFDVVHNGFGISFDMNYTDNVKDCKERLLPQNYERIALFNNPIIVNGSVMSEEDYEYGKDKNFNTTTFNIPGIYDSELQYGTVFFSIENITINTAAYIVVKIDVESLPDCFDYKGLWVEAWSSYLYSEGIYPEINDYISNHIYDESAGSFNATYRFSKNLSKQKYLFIEFSPRSDNIKYKIENDTSTGRYPVFISETHKKTVLGRRVFQLNVENLYPHDTVNFTVYYDKSLTIAFPEYYQLLLEDYTIYHEFYEDDEDFYDYDTKGSISFLDDQDDDMRKSSLTVTIPTVKEISKKTGDYTILEGDYYFKIYKLDYYFFYYGLHQYMDNVNPQIIKPFYIEKISNIKSDSFEVNFKSFLDSGETDYYLFDVVFISGNDYYKYPMNYFIFEKMGEVRPLTIDILYEIYDNQSLYRHFINEEAKNGTIRFKALSNVTTKYIGIYARYYNDTIGPVRLKAYDKDKEDIIYGDTEFQNVVFIPYDTYKGGKELFLDVACIRTCNITLDNWLFDDISDFYEGRFYGTFKLDKTGDLTFVSEYFRWNMNVFIFTDKNYPDVYINGKLMTDLVKNDFFLSIYIDLSKYSTLVTNRLEIKLHGQENTNISIFENYKFNPNNWLFAQLYENSTPTIYDYFYNSSCQNVALNVNMRNNFIFRFVSDSYLNVVFNGSEEIHQIRPETPLILRYPTIKKVDENTLGFCITTRTLGTSAMYALQVISNTDQTTSYAAVDPLYLNLTYQDYLFDMNVRVFTLGELTLDRKRFEYYNYLVTNGDDPLTELKVYFTRCDSYPVCIYNKEILDGMSGSEIKGEDGVFRKNIKTGLITTLHPDENYVMIVYCEHQGSYGGCTYDIGISESQIQEEGFPSGPIILDPYTTNYHHYITNENYGTIYLRPYQLSAYNYLVLNVQLFTTVYRELNMIRLVDNIGLNSFYPSWNNGSVLYIPHDYYQTSSYLHLYNQCVGECDIFFEATFVDDMDDQYLKNTMLTFPLEYFEGKVFYNSYSYKESNHLYVFSQSNRHKVNIYNYEVKGKESSFFKMTYINLLNIGKQFNDESHLSISITSTDSKDLISIYQKEDKIIDLNFKNSLCSSPVDYKFVDGETTETIYAPKDLNLLFALHVLSDNDLTFTFEYTDSSTVVKEVKAKTGSVFTYENGVKYTGDGTFTYKVKSSKLTFYSLQFYSNVNQNFTPCPGNALKLGVKYSDYLYHNSLRIFRLGELDTNVFKDYYQYNVTQSVSSEYTIKAWLEICSNYPICNISYASVTASKTSIELDLDGDNLYKNVEKRVLNDLNSVYNYILVVYCNHKSFSNGCYYTYSIRAFNSTGGGSSSSSSSQPSPSSSSHPSSSGQSSSGDDSSGDEPKESNVLTILFIIMIIIVCAVLIYFLYNKYCKQHYSIQQQIENLSNVNKLSEEDN
jgi:hypothetical protein